MPIVTSIFCLSLFPEQSPILVPWLDSERDRGCLVLTWSIVMLTLHSNTIGQISKKWMNFMNHITFRMPMLSSPSSRNFNELFQNCSSTTMTPYGKLRAIMKMAIHLAFMFVITVLWSEYCIA
jgi:hypothetical protein